MLSGYPFETAGQGALDAGAHGYLEKSDLVRGLIPRVETHPQSVAEQPALAIGPELSLLDALEPRGSLLPWPRRCPPAGPRWRA